jgi:trans-AT polyketide synthase/acyltransferase/oxidoreductase domain-containing protein
MPVIMFAGQGSQYHGMGADLFDEFPEYTAIADEVLGYSIRELCLDDRSDRLTRTAFAQPALYVVNVLTYLRFQRLCAVDPAAALGHSLGEYCALHIAGVFDFRTGLELVTARGRLMADSRPGAMAAVVGLDAASVHDALDRWTNGGLWVANYNAPDQVVVSGETAHIGAAKPHFLEAGARAYIHLKVSGAFHSPLMSAAQSEFQRVLSGTRLHAPTIPVVSNLSAAFYTDVDAERFLGEQISAPVRWTESIRLLAERGETQWIEIGPKRVLAPMVQKTLAA